MPVRINTSIRINDREADVFEQFQIPEVDNSDLIEQLREIGLDFRGDRIQTRFKLVIGAEHDEFTTTIDPNRGLQAEVGITISTNLVPDLDSTRDLGSTTVAWANLYADVIRSITGNALTLQPIAGQDLQVTLDTTGDLIVNTNDLAVDTSAGRVGVGTVTPAYKLDVSGDLNIASGQEVRINGTSVLNATTIGSGVVASSLTSLGTLSSLSVDQSSSTGAVPVATFDQADISEEFLRFIGSAAAATLTQSIVAEAAVTTATRQGFLKVFVQDDGNQITDQAYFIPIYTLA